MEPFTATNTLPLSIAQVDSTVYAEPEAEPAPTEGATPDVPALREQLLAAVVTRVGEVEAAEWALDQAKTARDEQIRAALASGVDAERLESATGLPVPALAELTGPREPAPTEG